MHARKLTLFETIQAVQLAQERARVTFRQDLRNRVNDLATLTCIAIGFLKLALPCLGQMQPTLEGTTDWISSRINDIGYTYSLRRAGQASLRVFSTSMSVLSFQKCTMHFETSITMRYDYANGSNLENTSVYKGTVQLKLVAVPTLWTAPLEVWEKQNEQLKLLAVPTIAPLGVWEKQYGPHELYTLKLRSISTKDPAADVTEYRTTNSYGGEKKELSPRKPSANEYTVHFDFTDRELGHRMLIAFQRATTFCGGGKTEAF